MLMHMSYAETKWREAGKEYENYIADKLRAQGWEVEQPGMDGVNDHGIDIIATKDGVKRYIQCKGWKRRRIIHEDVVTQLYGSVVAIEGIENIRNVELYIYSPAHFGNYAEYIAKRLNVWRAYEDFPAWHYDHANQDQEKPRRHRYWHRRHR